MKTDWYKPNQVPARRGYYERDHRNVWYIQPDENRIQFDLWEPVKNKRDPLYPGVWYCDNEYGINDATYQNLPWRGLTKETK